MSVCLVTGCSSGFGELIALELARRGDTVVATMRNAAKRKTPVADAAAAEGLAIEVDELDVTDEESVRACVTRVLDRHGRVDVLVNNAGIGRLGPVEEHADDEILEIFDTNVLGYLRCIRAVLPTMRTNGGTIVNVTSMAAFITVPFMGVYSASKAAIESFSEALHGELLPFGVRVVTVQPGAYNTPMALAADQMPRAHSDASPYAERAAQVRRHHLKSMEAQDNPQEVAEAVARVIHDDPDAVRVVLPAANEGMRGAAATMLPLDFRGLVRGIYGI